ncbi:MAG: hypothetical protein JXL80_18030 [Planctomycetes bacterium]|nr:hypothetical protein [Planctomycetota bacterium]
MRRFSQLWLLLMCLAATIAATTVTVSLPAAEQETAKPAAGQDAKVIEERDGCQIEKYAIHSKAMDKDIRIIVILPPGYEASGDKKYPILYTLHGKGAPYGTFSEMGPLRKALKDQPMIVTCLDGDKESWYVDSPVVKDSQYTTFFFKEFIPYVDKHYRVDADKRGLTGFSMGGWGAMHYMLVKPEMFASVSGLSSAIWPLNPPSDQAEKFLKPMLGDFAGNKDEYLKLDPHARIEQYLKKKVKLPPIYQHIGTEDFLLQANREFRGFLTGKGLQLEYKESPGTHNWSFWVGASAAMIDFHWRTFQKGYKPATAEPNK